jgi:hypothetical protein
VRVNASFHLEALADAFNAELYAELLEREGGPGRGLVASHASKTSPLVVVPMATALVAAEPGLPAAHQHMLKSPLSQVYPPELQALMMGVIPEAYGLWNLWTVQLAAALLWLRSSKPVGTQATSSGAQLQQAWQQYIEQVRHVSGFAYAKDCTTSTCITQEHLSLGPLKPEQCAS